MNIRPLHKNPKEKNMVFDLPCKLGEGFISLKFVDWVNGEKIYKEDETEHIVVKNKIITFMYSTLN